VRVLVVEDERKLGLLPLIGGILAVVFSATGIYGVLARWVSAQRRELGIRIALGASSASVGQLAFMQVLTLAVIGRSIGLPLGLLGLAL
jgi:putative ABC transport system permease protein